MRAIGIGRLSRHDDGKPVGESVLRCRANANIGLYACDDHPLDPLLAQEEGEISGEKSAVTALGGDDLARSRRREALEERRVGVANQVMTRQLHPLVVLEAGIVPLDGVHDEMATASRPRQELPQRGQYVGRLGIIVRHSFEEEGIDAILGALVSQLDPLTWLAWALVPAVAFALARTRWGLRLRATGAAEATVRSVGLAPLAIRDASTVFAGAL